MVVTGVSTRGLWWCWAGGAGNATTHVMPSCVSWVHMGHTHTHTGPCIARGTLTEVQYTAVCKAPFIPPRPHTSNVCHGAPHHLVCQDAVDAVVIQVDEPVEALQLVLTQCAASQDGGLHLQPVNLQQQAVVAGNSKHQQ